MSAASDSAVSRVIDRWVGIEAGGYQPGDPLRGLWAVRHPASPAFEPHGIVRLINEIRADQLLGQCGDANDLGPGHFVTGGFVQTVQNLRDWVNPCGE